MFPLIQEAEWVGEHIFHKFGLQICDNLTADTIERWAVLTILFFHRSTSANLSSNTNSYIDNTCKIKFENWNQRKRLIMSQTRFSIIDYHAMRKPAAIKALKSFQNVSHRRWCMPDLIVINRCRPAGTSLLYFLSTTIHQPPIDQPS